MEKFLKKLFLYFIIAIVVYLGAVVAVSYFKNQTFGFDTEYLSDVVTLFVTGMILAVMLLFKLFKLADGKGDKKKKSKGIDKAKDDKGKEVSQYFSSDFVPVEELRTKGL